MEPGQLHIQLLYAFGVVVPLVLLGIVWNHRNRTAAVPLICYIVTGLLYSTVQLLNVTVHDVAVSRMLFGALFVVITLSMMSLFVFAVEYTGREQLVRWELLAVLAIHPVVVAYFASVNPGNVFFESLVVDPSTVYGVAVEYGLGAQIHAVYTYVLIAAAVFMFVDLLYRSQPLYRGQSVALVVGTLLPGTTTLLTLNFDLAFDLTPIGILLAGGLFTIAIVRYRLADIVPIARDRVLDSVSDAVFVIDRDDRLIDANSAAQDLFDSDTSSIGNSIEEILTDYPQVLDTYRAVTDRWDEREKEVVYAGRYYRVRTTPIDDSRGRYVGWLVLVHDITERKRREVQLERQNERLDQFAKIVSHDLRNPLNVADGYVDLAVETGNTDYLEVGKKAHARIDAIIEDVLALAREGAEVTDPERVDFRGLIERAWGNVDTVDASLTVESNGIVVADADRASRLFENLFHNAVEHGSATPASQARQDAVERSSTNDRDGSVGSIEHDHTNSRPWTEGSSDRGDDAKSIGVRVTVGILPPDETGLGGFYVEDDGVGIPADSRDRVFEHGVSTSEDGTGLGLGIVQQIVDAHGWTVSVEESESGGARFVFDGVRVTDTQPVRDRISGTDCGHSPKRT